MFPLRDRTRRWICRTIFLAVGVAPTLSIIGWCMAMASPDHVADVRAQLANALGIDLRFEKFSLPRPGATLIEGLEIADPETGESLASIGRLEMRADEQHPTWIISTAELNAVQTDWLVRLVERRLQLGADWHKGRPRVKIGEFSLRCPGGSHEFVDGDFQFAADETARSLTGIARSANTPAASPIEVQIVRSLDASGAPSTTCDLRSTDAPLSCSLIGALLCLENHLGAQSSWQGTLRVSEIARRWRGELKGQLKDVDLHAAISSQFAAQLNGRAEIDIRRLIIDSGRLQACEGTVRARDGSISGQLLMASRSLNLRTVDVQPSDRLLIFNELQCEFAVDSTGVSLIGRCGKPEDGVLLRSQSSPLAVTANPERASITALINVLVVPNNRQPIPATRQADLLLHGLPMMDEK